MKRTPTEPEPTSGVHGGASAQTGQFPEAPGYPRYVGSWVLEPQLGLEFTFHVEGDGGCEVFDHEDWECWLAVHGHDEPELRLLAHVLHDRNPYREGYRSCLYRCRVSQQVVADIGRTEAILQACPAARLPEALEQRITQALTEVFWAEVNPQLDPPLEQEPLVL